MRKRPIQEQIEAQYGGKPIEEIVRELYAETGSFDAVAREIGTSRQTLYRWLGVDRLARIRAMDVLRRESGGSETGKERYE